MTPTALIAEDEPLLAQALQADLLREWPELRIVANVGDGAQALRQTLALRPSLCFLDIRMPALSGLEVAQALAEDWTDAAPAGAGDFPLLVFITAYDEYAVKAFEAQAVDYLLKPVQAERLALCCDRLRRRLAQPAPLAQLAQLALTQAVEQLRALLGSAAGASPAAAAPLEVLTVGIGSTVHLVPIDEVIYIEAADKYLRVITAEREHLIRLSLRELDAATRFEALLASAPRPGRAGALHRQRGSRRVGPGPAHVARSERKTQREPPLRAPVQGALA